MRLPNGIKMKDAYRVSISQDGTFQYAISKQSHNELIDNIKMAGKQTTKVKDADGNTVAVKGQTIYKATYTYENLMEGLIPRAFQYHKLGLGQIFNRIKDTFYVKVSAKRH